MNRLLRNTLKTFSSQKKQKSLIIEKDSTSTLTHASNVALRQAWRHYPLIFWT